MSKTRASNLRLLVADPDRVRRERVISHLGGIRTIEAASLAEAFDLAESQQPNAVIMAVELSGDSGLPMFLRLVDALSAHFLMFGQAERNATPAKYRKSIDFYAIPDGGDAKGLRERLVGGPPCYGPAHDTRKTVGSHPGEGPRLVVVGASTGGVSALETVLTSFPADCPPTLVVQHIRAGFIDSMITRLEARCLPNVQAARDAIPVEAGNIYVAADPEAHLLLQSAGTDLRCRLRADPPRHGHRPSVDALFESVAPHGRGVAAALLTGMGADGAEGMGRIRSAGGFTIAQDESSCVVYGMPRVAIEKGAAATVLPLDLIAEALLGKCAPPRERELSAARETVR